MARGLYDRKLTAGSRKQEAEGKNRGREQGVSCSTEIDRG
jgi:hypothetical protein